MWLQMNLVLHMKCWVFPFILKIPHLPLIIVIFVSPFLDEYISIAFLPRLFIKYRHQGPNAARFPTCLTRWLSTLQDQPGPPKTQLLPFTSTHTTSSPRCRIPTPGQGGSCLPGVYWYFCNCMSSQGLGELLWMWWWRNISIPFFFFLMHSTFSMHLSLFSGLHMRASRLKPYCQAEALLPGWSKKDMLWGDRGREGQPSSRPRDLAPRSSQGPLRVCFGMRSESRAASPFRVADGHCLSRFACLRVWFSNTTF